MGAPKGWSKAARCRAGKPAVQHDEPCWGCGVTGCAECGPSPDAEGTGYGLAVTDESDDV